LVVKKKRSPGEKDILKNKILRRDPFTRKREGDLAEKPTLVQVAWKTKLESNLKKEIPFTPSLEAYLGRFDRKKEKKGDGRRGPNTALL